MVPAGLDRSEYVAGKNTAWYCPFKCEKIELMVVDVPEYLPGVGPGEAAGAVVRGVGVGHIRGRHHVPGHIVK